VEAGTEEGEFEGVVDMVDVERVEVSLGAEGVERAEDGRHVSSSSSNCDHSAVTTLTKTPNSSAAISIARRRDSSNHRALSFRAALRRLSLSACIC